MTVSGTNTDATEAFRAALRAFRKARGLSAQAVSDQLTEAGHLITRTSLSNYENGRSISISLDIAVGIAQILDVPLADMLLAVCDQCGNHPPAGFTCNICGRTGDGTA